MNRNRFTRRRAVGLAVGIGLLATQVPATAASLTTGTRTATTAVDTTYLADTLGLPADTVVEPVTYDRLQWLLQQPGQFAFLIGSPTNVAFKASAQKVDAAAKAARAGKVYWFDTNLTGQPGVRNLDIRNAGGINLSAASQTIFGNAWKNLVGQYLGNGVKAVPAATRTSVTITADNAVVNDAVDPLFEYRTGRTAAVASTDDVFFVYDKARTASGAADRIADWVRLAGTSTSDAELAAAFTAIGGGAAVDELSQFAWWKDATNTKHDLAYADDARYGGDIISDEDAANGWRVQQVTYPELLHVLNQKDEADKNFVLLFGGTWCHNTRAVLKDINKQAQANGVKTVYNFDLVLDGGTTNGTNGGANPIHVRADAASGTNFSFRPSYVYGDVVRTFFKNLVTEYDPNTGSRVSFYPNGDLTAFPDVVRRLQVPFLVNYQRGAGAAPAGTAVKRQWIQQNVDASTGLSTYREFMSEWWFTKPSAQLGLDFVIPKDESSLTDAQKAALAQARSNAAFGAEAVAKLGDFFGGLPGAVLPVHTVSAKTVTAAIAPRVTVTFANTFGRKPAGTTQLKLGGRTYKGVLTGNAVTFTLPKLKAGAYAYTVVYGSDPQILGFEHHGTLRVKK